MPEAFADSRTVYVIEDDSAARASLVFALESTDYRVEAFEAAEQFLAAVNVASAQGCIICDLHLPGMGGMEVLSAVIQRGSALPVILVTAFGEVAMAVAAMQAGALDFVEKPFEPGQVVAAVQAAMATKLPPHLLRSASAAAKARLANLSVREREVYESLVIGRLGKEAARDLGLSPRTVEVHRANIMRRLGVRTLPELVRLSVLAGLHE